MKSKYFSQGLGVLTPGAGWINSDGSAVNASGNPDLYLMSNDINTAKMTNRVTAYGDWFVTSVLSDDATDKMKVTFVKGSPYLFSQFANPASVEVYSNLISQLFDDSNTSILTTDGASLTGDHLGIKIANVDGSPAATPQTRYYGIFAPPGTVFRRVRRSRSSLAARRTTWRWRR